MQLIAVAIGWGWLDGYVSMMQMARSVLRRRKVTSIALFPWPCGRRESGLGMRLAGKHRNLNNKVEATPSNIILR